MVALVVYKPQYIYWLEGQGFESKLTLESDVDSIV